MIDGGGDWMKTAELIGADLDYWVAKAEGLPVHPGPGRYVVAAPIAQRWAHEFSFSTDWRAGGPIIEREKIATWPNENNGWIAMHPTCSGGYISHGTIEAHEWSGYKGATPLIAAMRAYVASCFGDEVSLEGV